MDLDLAYICACNGKNYKTKSSLNAHMKTKIHIQWQNESELRGLKIQLTQRDNKIISLNEKMKTLRETNVALHCQITDREKQICKFAQKTSVLKELNDVLLQKLKVHQNRAPTCASESRLT